MPMLMGNEIALTAWGNRALFGFLWELGRATRANAHSYKRDKILGALLLFICLFVPLCAIVCCPSFLAENQCHSPLSWLSPFHCSDSSAFSRAGFSSKVKVALCCTLGISDLPREKWPEWNFCIRGAGNGLWTFLVWLRCPLIRGSGAWQAEPCYINPLQVQ